MSLRLQLLQVARLAPRLLGDSTDLVRAFYASQFTDSGAACDRAGQPDLYYTIFALAGAQALDAPFPAERIRSWLGTFGDGAALDFVHLGALARCWAAVGSCPRDIATAILGRLENYRQPDGGYNSAPTAGYGTAYDAFVALGAYEDLGMKPPAALGILKALRALETPSHAWTNMPGQTVGSLNPTAAAVTLISHLGLPVSAAIGDWILQQVHPQGGFLAVPGAPLPDLLSSATALHALACMNRRISSALHEKCLDFADSLWDAKGGFHGHWADDFVDPEYTFYGLLFLGHLAV